MQMHTKNTVLLTVKFSVGTALCVYANAHKEHRASDCEIVGTALCVYANAHKEHRASDCEIVGTACVYANAHKEHRASD